MSGFVTNYPLPPDSAPEEMAIETIRQVLKQSAHDAEEFRSIKATLICNCYPGRCLAKLGITYDEKRSVLANLIVILEKFIAIAEQVKRDNAAIPPESRERRYPTDENRQ